MTQPQGYGEVSSDDMRSTRSAQDRLAQFRNRYQQQSSSEPPRQQPEAIDMGFDSPGNTQGREPQQQQAYQGQYGGAYQGQGQYGGAYQGQGQDSYQGQGQDSYQGQGQGHGQYNGAYRGRDSYRGQGQGQGQYNDAYRGQGQGQGQYNDAYRGQGQGQGQYNDAYRGQGQGQGQYNGAYQGQGQGQGQSQGQYNGAYQGQGQGQGQYNGAYQGQGQGQGQYNGAYQRGTNNSFNGESTQQDFGGRDDFRQGNYREQGQRPEFNASGPERYPNAGSPEQSRNEDWSPSPSPGAGENNRDYAPDGDVEREVSPQRGGRHALDDGHQFGSDAFRNRQSRHVEELSQGRDMLNGVEIPDDEDHWDDVDEDIDSDMVDDLYSTSDDDFADIESLDDESEDKDVSSSGKGGVLGWLKRLTGRTSKVSDFEQYVTSINRKLRQPQVIGVIGSKGGVGKTSKSQILGSILAHYRTEGGVVAADLDANSTLIQRMQPQTSIPEGASIHSFAHDPTVRTSADVNSYLVLNEEKLAVLAGVGMTGSAPLRKDELQRVLNRLGEFYTLIILDFPGSAEVPVAMHALKVIDAMVYVAEITSSSLSSTKRDLRRIANVRPELLSTATIILNHRTAGKVHIKNLEGHVEDFRNMGIKDTTGTSMVRVFETNFDPHIAIEGPIHISKLDPVNRNRYIRIAASVMDSLPGRAPGYMRYEEAQRQLQLEREAEQAEGREDGMDA